LPEGVLKQGETDMSIYESNTVIFHGVTEESRKTIHSFLQGYLDLFQKHFGEDKMDGYIYIGGIPTYEFELDMDYEPFPRDEGYYVMGISPRWAKARYWENNPGFVGIFLEQKLCSKITWHQYWDQGEPNRIYMNDSTENVPASWKYYEFVPGENGVPAEYDDENEDDDEAFNQFVNEVMKGGREVKWKDGFPDYWHDRYDEMEARRDREEMEDFDFGFDHDDDEKDESEKTDFDVESKLKTLVAQNEKTLLANMQHVQMRIKQQLDYLKSRQLELDSDIKSKMNSVSNWRTVNRFTEISDDSFADKTGNKVCPRCHHPVEEENAPFCENCGQKI